MLRIALLSLIVLVSCSSATLLRKSIVRRQNNQPSCQAIQGFDCECSSDRVTCTTERDLPQTLTIVPNEREKYTSVELVINGERDYNVNEHTFETVKQLFKPDVGTLEFRVKFNKFTKLNLEAPGVFNRVFPDNTPATTRKHLALDILNQNVQPNDNANLFANLNVDSLEIYTVYSFRGTFQQLFTGANIKYLRLSGADIRSDLSQPFTGNVGRLELAKQASQLTAQTFPIYPAHEMIIHAYYVTDFNSDNPPNYSNLGEIRVHSQQRIPANAFRNYPDLRTLSITGAQDIDPHAFDGLQKLEKLAIKDAKPSLELLKNLPNLKELELSLEKFDTQEQCMLAEKVSSGQLAVQAAQGGQGCTCELAYFDSASGQRQCDAQNCDRSSCNAIRSSYDSSTQTFKAPPAIRRVDGSDAFRQREPKVYTGAYQITREDQNKAQQTAAQVGNEQGGADRHDSHPTAAPEPSYDPQQNPDGQWQQGQPDHSQHPDPRQGEGSDAGQAADGSDNTQDRDGNQNREDGDGTGNQQEGDGSHAHHNPADPNQSTEVNAVDGTGVAPSTKKKLGWLPIIIIIAVVAGLLLILLIILLVRKKRSAAGYNPAATSEHGAPPARA